MLKSTLKLVAAIVLFASCNQYEKAPSGMLYKISHGSGNPQKLAQGQFVKVNLEYKLKSKDTILSTTYGQIPVYSNALLRRSYYRKQLRKLEAA